jgi:5-methylcytosine-specific restriction endonuclease McrA
MASELALWALKRPCLGCGHPVEGASWHPACDTRPPYDAEWARIAKEQVRREPQCRKCGHTGSKDNPLSADHVIPRARGGTSDASNLQTLCRRHNSEKGDR